MDTVTKDYSVDLNIHVSEHVANVIEVDILVLDCQSEWVKQFTGSCILES